MARRTYGWRPDKPDARDHVAKAASVFRALPKRVDLRDRCMPVQDQGSLGSCTAHAIAGALGYIAKDGPKITAMPIVPSRLFIYYQERVIEGTVKVDAGAEIRDGVKACAKVGVPAESLWRYTVSKFAMKPTARAYTDASRRKITEYQRVTGLRALRTSLADEYPVVFGFSVYESFESDEVAATGVVPMPKLTERLLGGHAVLAVGYDDTSARVIVRNSWGPKWGDAGYFTLPYEYVTSKELSDDFWSIRA